MAHEILRSLHVIVPIASKEELWRDLLADLYCLPEGARVSLVGPELPDPIEIEQLKKKFVFQLDAISSSKGLALQMNTAAFQSRHEYFWFLHADSKVPKSSIAKLSAAFSQKPNALHYFNLKYLDDGPRWMFLNSLGARYRSKFFGLPFGDQGFAISRTNFVQVGGFDETASGGEDHIFIWRAYERGIPLHAVASTIYTSARRYESTGWGRTTGERIVKAAHHAVQERFRYVKNRVLR